jgi:hypothetical protein
MADVSHRDNEADLVLGLTSLSGAGSPEGVVEAVTGSIYRRTDGAPGEQLYVKETFDLADKRTGWVAYGAAGESGPDLTVEVAALQAADVVLDGRLDVAEEDISNLQDSDVALDTRLDALEAVTLAPVATSGSATDLTTGTLPIARLPALTGDVTSSAGSAATTIGAGKVTNAMHANMAASTIKGSIAGGAPADLTATEATALLNAANATTKGLVPTPPNVTTQFLRGDASWAAPKQKLFLTYSCDTITAGTTDRYLNPAGYGTTPAGTSAYYYTIPVTGSLISTQVQNGVAHTTSTFTVSPRLSGTEQTTQQISMSSGTLYQRTVHATPLAVTQGDYLACQVDHNGATNIRFSTVTFEIEF